MQISKYNDILLIGFGNIYKNIMKYMISVRKNWDFRLSIIEHEFYPISCIESVCEVSDVNYRKLQDKKELLLYLLGFEESTLIISAGNKFLFPAELVKKENITIINFHNALLPAYPGRNAPSWAIYNNEQYAGATWHIVTEDVDAGGILWQKPCELPPDIKAYEAVRKIMDLAYEGFKEIAKPLFSGVIKAVEQKADLSDRKIYYAKDIPGDGIVKITDPPEYIYRVLRATDFGLNPIFPKIKIVLEDGAVCYIKRYKKEEFKAEHKDEPLKKYHLTLDSKHVLKLDVDICRRQ